MTDRSNRCSPAAKADTAEAGGNSAPGATSMAARDAAANTVAPGRRPSVDEVDAVMWVAQLLVAISARSLAAIETEVSLPQLRVLVTLASQGPRSLNAIAHTLSIHPSNATRACDKLVAAGLIRRDEDPEDRRLLALSLTRAGTQLIDKVMQHRRAQIEELLSDVPASQRRVLARALRALAAAGGDTFNQAAWQAGWTTAHRNDSGR